MTMVTAALPHDQSLRSANASSGPFHGDWFIQDEIGAHFKGLLNIGSAIDQGEGNATFIGFSLTQLPQHYGAILNVIAVNHHSVILAPHQDVAGLVRGVAKIQVNVGRVQNSAYRTMYFGVATKEKSLQCHIQKLSERLGRGQVTNVTAPGWR